MPVTQFSTEDPALGSDDVGRVTGGECLVDFGFDAEHDLKLPAGQRNRIADSDDADAVDIDPLASRPISIGPADPCSHDTWSPPLKRLVVPRQLSQRRP